MRFFTRVAATVAALTLSMAGILAAQAGGPKIVYVNSQKIIAQAPGRADAEAQFQKEMDQYKAQVQKMGDSLQTMVADYQKAEPTLSQSVKATRTKDLRDRQQAYQQHVQQLEQTAQQREAELVRPIMEQINKIIEQIRAADGDAEFEAFFIKLCDHFGVAVEEAAPRTYIANYKRRANICQQKSSQRTARNRTIDKTISPEAFDFSLR